MNGQKIEAAAHTARPTMTNIQVSIDSPDVTRHTRPSSQPSTAGNRELGHPRHSDQRGDHRLGVPWTLISKFRMEHDIGTADAHCHLAARAAVVSRGSSYFERG
jgi:hypothetical protein